MLLEIFLRFTVSEYTRQLLPFEEYPFYTGGVIERSTKGGTAKGIAF